MSTELYRIDPALIDAVMPDHMVSMTREHPAGGAVSVGTCRCGAVFRAAIDGIAGANRMTRQIEAHWRAVLSARPVPT